MGRKKQITDAQLLAFAQTAFIKAGFSASTREIAAAAGVSEAVLFQRYRTKAELFFAAMVPPPIQLDHLFEQPDADPRLQLKRVFIALIDYFRAARPILSQLSVHPDFRFDDFAAKHPESSMITMFQQLMRFIVEHLDSERDPAGATLLLITSAHSLAYFEGMGAHGGRFEPFMIDQILDQLWRGMKPVEGQTKAGKGKPVIHWPRASSS